MRISDWSSDVCASDLAGGTVEVASRRHGIHVGADDKLALARLGSGEGGIAVAGEVLLDQQAEPLGTVGEEAVRRLLPFTVGHARDAGSVACLAAKRLEEALRQSHVGANAGVGGHSSSRAGGV